MDDQSTHKIQILQGQGYQKTNEIKTDKIYCDYPLDSHKDNNFQRIRS